LEQTVFVFAGAAWLVLAGAVPNGLAQNAAQLISTRSTSIPLPAGGNSDSVDPQISPDGRFVLFNSTAGNLVPNCGGQLCSQVFLRDRLSNTTTLVSVNVNGFGGNGNSSYGGMSRDGRYVVFASDASDLVAGDTNGFSDIFVRDMVAGITVLASVSSSGVEGNGPSRQPVMTPDGRYVAFISTSTNLASGSRDNPDIFLRDVAAQTTVAMSSAGTGSPATGAIISSLSITTNGRYVAFVSTALNLVSGVTQSGGEVYVRDFVGGGIIWASSNATSTAAAIFKTGTPASEHAVISDDGTWVAFKTGSNYLARLPAVIFQYNCATAVLTTIYTNGIYSIYGDDVYGPEMTPDGRFIVFTSGEQGTTTNGSIRLWDSETATNALVSTNLSGVYSTNTLAQAPAVTPDGRYVVFLSNAGDLTRNAVANGSHIFRCDLQSGAMTMLDVDTNGVGSTDFTGTVPSVSTNGQFIAFGGPDGGLVPLDINGANDVFVRDAIGGTTEMVSQRDPSVPTRSGDRISSEGPLSISGDGRWVAFASYANDLVTNDTNNARDIFVCDRWSGSNTLVSVGQNGGAALGGDSMTPMISTNGQYVVFVSAATNLTAGNVITNPGTCNVYRRDLQAQTTVLVSVSTNGVLAGNNDSTSPVISQDGRYVAFLSQANNLAAGLTGTENTFWYDVNAGTNLALGGTAAAFAPTMSANGRYVAYANATQVFVWDTQQGSNIYTNTASPDGTRLLYQSGTTINVRDLVNGTNMLTVAGAQKIRSPGVWSGDGRFVAVVTSSAISGLDGNNTNDVYLADLLSPTQILASVNWSITGSGNAGSDWPAVSWDGRYVVFRSFSTNLVAGHTAAPDLYLYDSVTGTNSLLTLEQPASDWMQRPSKPVISMDVSSAVFQSFGSGLGFGHVSGLQDVFAALLPPAANADSDGDGIPDWWMIQYFGHLTGQAFDQSLAQDDPNGTGMTTLQDYIAGTIPTDPDSVFEASVTPAATSGGDVTLVWQAVAGRTYSVQYKDNLEDPTWQALGGAPIINGNQGQFTVPTDQGSRYYRIVVAAP
jgi:Tol biopolymer transport system component